MSFNYLNPVLMNFVEEDNDTAVAEIEAQGSGKRLRGLMVWAAFNDNLDSARLLTIKVGESVVLKLPITESGPAPIQITGIITGPNEAISAELEASGTGGIIGYVGISAEVQ